MEQHRTFSAGQLSKAFQTWLLSIVKCPKAAMKIGSAIHLHLVSSYQSIWKSKCAMNKMSGLDFKSRLACSPRGVPLHELSENDYVIYANHETIARAKAKKKIKNKKTKSGYLQVSPSQQIKLVKLLQVLIQRNAKGLSLQMTSSIFLHRSRQNWLGAKY
jgi:hypothetical protein